MRTLYTPGRPNFVADWDSVDRDTGHTIDWALVPENFRAGAFLVTTSGAAAAAVALPLSAPLPGDIPAGTNLYFGEAGELARVTVAAAKGFAGSLTVDPLPAAIEAGDTAPYAPDRNAPKVLPAGTRLGEAGTTNGRYAPRTATRPALALLAADVIEFTGTQGGGHHNRGAVGVILGGVIYENLLPGATGTPARIPTAERTELETAGVGTGFSWRQYRDSTT